MAREATSSPGTPSPLRVEGDEGVWTFDRPFTVGRENSDVVVDNARASRNHLQISPNDGVWWLQDLGSSNGTYVDGERVERVEIAETATVQVGEGGLFLRLSVEGADGASQDAAASSTVEPATASTPDPFRPQHISGGASLPTASLPIPDRPIEPPDTPEPSPNLDTSTPADASSPETAPTSEKGADGELSYDAVVQRYFGEEADEEQMGERTRFIRQAYDDIQKAQEEMVQKQHSRYRGLIVAALLVSIAAVGYAIHKEVQRRNYLATAQSIFLTLQEERVDFARDVTAVQEMVAANPALSDSLRASLDRAYEIRQQTAERYANLINQLGVYDGLTDQEQLIFQTARAFGESELTIPPAFVEEVKREIRFWQSNSSFVTSIRRAQSNGHDVEAVNALRRHGMPLEFFYLVMQESKFDTKIVGPPTRYGHAKGAWQFIPATGRRYGLETGPLVDTNQYDPLDERHDFPQAADAAARYLRDIYVHLAQASGLLVCASYNWGEGNIRKNMRQLQQDLSDIDNDPEHRTYWKFLTTYRNRMPKETKDYVMKIFAAAVIGRNPRAFGIDLDSPIERALRGGTGGVSRVDAPASGLVPRLGRHTIEQELSEEPPDIE
ncbi:MAG: hypothetical protein Rubg2KO_37680 [Rubricoccaceae bacterium]